MTAIDEYSLVDRLKCPLMDTGGLAARKFFYTGIETLHWLLRRYQDSDVTVPTSVIREKYTAYWKLSYYSQYENSPAPLEDKGFWEGPRRARVVARRLADLMTKFSPVVVNYPYVLNLGDRSITGVVDIVARRRGSGSRQTLLLPMEFVTRYSHRPDAIRMARWLWCFNTSGIVDQDTYNLPFFRGKPWVSPPMNPEWAQQKLALMTLVTNSPPFSYGIPGTHCQQCLSARCMGVYERQDDNRG